MAQGWRMKMVDLPVRRKAGWLLAGAGEEAWSVVLEVGTRFEFVVYESVILLKN